MINRVRESLARVCVPAVRLRAVPTSTFDTVNAGARPKIRTVTSESASVKTSTRAFTSTSIGIGAAVPEASTSRTRLPHQANSRPRAPPIAASSRLSVKS